VIERVLLVAWTELSATLLTRAFIMMVLTPIIALMAYPLIVGPVLLLANFTETESEVISETGGPPMQVYDGTGELFEPLKARLEGTWQATLNEGDPEKSAETLYDGDAEVHLVLAPDAIKAGAYTIHTRGLMSISLGDNDLAMLEATVVDLIAEARLLEAGLSEKQLRQALKVEGTVEEVDASQANAIEIFAQFADYAVPGAVLFMMFGALSMAGQGLLTSTLEEKSTRVAEVLLGAVSPVELLTGKILGQLGVSGIFAMVWGGPGLFLLAWFGSYYVGPITVIYIGIFIGIAAVSWAAVMGGIGSAVNDLTEAQHLLAPLFMVMMMLFIPAVFAIADPDSAIIVAASLIPPSSPAVMAARLVSSVPPPHWQVWISLVTSAAFAVVLVLAAGRLFKIGLLLRGSPPNVRTLIRWVMTS